MDGSVYSPTEGSSRQVAFAIPIQPIVKDGTAGLMHVAKAGEWKGHPSGPFEFSAELFDGLVERFNARTDQALVVDYNHKSVDPKTPEDAAAAAWVRALYRSGEGDEAELWAAVEFTERAAEMVRKGEYLFCSPVVAWDAPDTRTAVPGPELVSAALTNQPFQDHLSAIALSRVASLAKPEAVKPSDAPVEQEAPKEAAPQEQAPKDETAPPSDEPKPEDAPPPAAPEEESGSDVVLSIANEVGVDRATVEQVMTANLGVFAKAISDALERVKKEQQMSVPPSQAPDPTMLSRVAALEKQLTDERAERAKQVVLSRVDALIAGGYATEDMRRYVTHELTLDLEEGAKRFSKKIVPVGEVQAGNRDQTIHKPKLTELSTQELLNHTALTAAGYSSNEALNRVIARRDLASGKAA